MAGQQVEQMPPESPHVLDRGQVLASLGYHADKLGQPMHLPEDKDMCHRCGRKVYPVEQVDIGALYHRGCFKCRICNGQLSLKNFQQQLDPQTRTKEVYCNIHVPRHTVGLTDKEALAIRSAMEAQSANVRKRGAQTEEGWEYDHQALEFQHLRRGNPAGGQKKERKKVRRSSTLRSFQDFERYGIFDAQTALEKVQKDEEEQLYLQMAEDRHNQVEELREFVETEKRRTVRDLIQWFIQRGLDGEEKQAGVHKVEHYFNRLLEERLKLVQYRLAAEEQSAVARMTEKHAQEMIALIAEKERLAELDMKRHREKFQRQHEVAQKEGQGEGVKALPAGTDSATAVKESANTSVEKPDVFFNQVEAIDFMGKNHRLSTKHSTASDILQAAGGKSVKPAKKNDKNVSDTSGSHSGDTGHKGSSKKVKTMVKLTQIGTAAAPTARQMAAGFVPITPVREEVKAAPGSVDWEAGESDDESESEDDVGKVDARFAAVKVDVSDDSVQYDDEEEVDDLDESESEADLTDSDESYHTKSTGGTLDTTGSGSACLTHVDKKGKPFVQLEQPGTKERRKKTPHPGGKKKAYVEQDSEMMEGSYNLEEAELRDNRLNEKLDPSRWTEVSTPVVEPPRNTKSKLYTSPKVFEEFDNNAIQEAQKKHKTYTDLVKQLSWRCTTELQKVRAIFRWLTVKDLNKLTFEDSLDPESPVAHLHQIKQGLETYHNLFKRLCSYAGLHCEIIEGYSKGAGYKPGSRIKDAMFRNQWTAVWVEGSWRFINSNWGARHVKGPAEEALTYKCDEFYFLTDPHEHIYQHFPDDIKWQLLKRPLSMEEFLRLPVVKSPFFNINLAFADNYSSVLENSAGLQELKLVCPQWYNFAGKLRSREHNIPSEVLQERILIRTIGQDVVFLINLPAPGRYYLDIFVAPDPRSNSMDHACGFMLRCSGITKELQMVYPQMGMFGRTPYSERFRIEEETHIDSYLACRDDVVVAITTDDHIRLSHTFRWFNMKEKSFEDYDRLAFLKHKGDRIASYQIRCPKRGLYVLSMMAESHGGDPSHTSNPHCGFRYIVDCRHPSQNTQPFPKTSKRWQHCKLLSPVTGDLPQNRDIRFKIESAIAEEIVVVVGEDWNHLECSGNMWTGTVKTGTAPSKVLVYGRVVSGKKYIPCLEYSVVNQRT